MIFSESISPPPKFRKALISAVFELLILFIFCGSVFAEGSKQFNTKNSDYRVGLQGDNIFGFYAAAGETVYIGTSSINKSNDITVVFPNGTSTDYNATSSVGYIKNRTQEVAGPKPLNSSGYTPITLNITQTGFYKVTIRSCRTRIDQKVSASWPDNASSDTETQAWDITVVGIDGTVKNGRVFCSSLRLTVGDTSDIGAKNTTYFLTNDGYIFSVDTGMIRGVNWRQSANNRGIVYADTNTMIYASSYVSLSKYSYYSLQNVSEAFKYISNGDIMYRLFFSYPDADLLEALNLSNPLPTPVASNFKFVGSYKGNQSFMDEGGVFSFDANADYGVYELRLDFLNDPTGERSITFGNRINYKNSISWNGRDKLGNIVPLGSYTATLTMKAGEIHFQLDDIEYIDDGIKIKLLNAPDGYANTTVYYDNTPTIINGVATDMYKICKPTNKNCSVKDVVMYNGNLVNTTSKSTIYLYGAPNRKDGVDSYAEPAQKTANLFSDQKDLDIWAYYRNTNTYSTPFLIIELGSTISLQITKSWKDDDNRDLFRPDRIQFTMYCDAVECGDNPYTITAADNWSIEIEVPVSDNYSVVETMPVSGE